MIFTWRIVRLSGLIAVDLAALMRLAPNWSALGHDLREPGEWLARVGTDAAAATLVAAGLWLCAVWVAVGLAVLAATIAPGRLGDGAMLAARRLLPATIVRLVAGAAGASIVLLPVSAGAATVSAAAAAAPPSAGLSWPTTGAPLAAVALGWPASAAPATKPSEPIHPRHPAPVVRGPSPGRVVVAPHDCLWTLAGAHLVNPTPSQVAAATRRWYAINRTVIGADPNLLRPGTVLIQPTSTDEGGAS